MYVLFYSRVYPQNYINQPITNKITIKVLPNNPQPENIFLLAGNKKLNLA